MITWSWTKEEIRATRFRVLTRPSNPPSSITVCATCPARLLSSYVIAAFCPLCGPSNDSHYARSNSQFRFLALLAFRKFSELRCLDRGWQMVLFLCFRCADCVRVVAWSRYLKTSWDIWDSWSVWPSGGDAVWLRFWMTFRSRSRKVADSPYLFVFGPFSFNI